MGLLSSLSKSFKLRTISNRLAAEPGRLLNMDDVMGRSPYIQKQRAAEQALFDLVEGNATLKAVMDQHGAARADLSKVYGMLVGGGAGQWVRGHWVAASALAFPATLEFVLLHTRENRDSMNISVPHRLAQYFGRGEVGPITDYEAGAIAR